MQLLEGEIQLRAKFCDSQYEGARFFFFEFWARACIAREHQHRDFIKLSLYFSTTTFKTNTINCCKPFEYKNDKVLKLQLLLVSTMG